MRAILFLFTVLSYLVSEAQQTVQLEEGEPFPKASLEEVSWIAGHWKGEALGGIAEELWSEPLGGSMMFVFRLVHDDTVTFYETGHIKQIGSTLIMQLKHFDGGLKGWEEKEETVDFRLVKLEENKVFFEGLTMEKISDTEMDVFVLVENEGKKEELHFKYQRTTSK